MRKKFKLFLSGLFLGFGSYSTKSKYDPKIGDDSQKGPPVIKNLNLAYLTATDRTITKKWNK